MIGSSQGEVRDQETRISAGLWRIDHGDVIGVEGPDVEFIEKLCGSFQFV